MVSILVYGLKLEATKEGSSPSDALILCERCELKKMFTSGFIRHIQVYVNEPAKNHLHPTAYWRSVIRKLKRQEILYPIR